MLFSKLRAEDEEVKDPIELKNDLDNLEFQIFRMQDNLKEIAKKGQVIGIDQSKEDKWVIVYAVDDGNSCKVMLNDCEAAYK